MNHNTVILNTISSGLVCGWKEGRRRNRRRNRMEAEGLQACGQTTTDEMFLVIRIWAFCHLMIISRDYGTYIQTEVETSVSF